MIGKMIGLLLVAVGCSATTTRTYPNNQPTNAPTVCMTDTCKTASEYYLNAINTSVDPCQDFYTFSCGGWMNQNQPDIDAYTMVQLKVYGILENLLDNVNPSDATLAQSVIVAKTLYDSCKASSLTQAGNSMGLLNTIMSPPFLGYPMMQQSAYNTPLNQQNVVTMIGNVEGTFGWGTLMQSYVSNDWTSVYTNIMYQYMGALTMGARPYYTLPIFQTQLANYATFIAQVTSQLARMNGQTVDSAAMAQMQADATAVVNFETALANIQKDPTETRNYIEQYNVFSIADAKKRWPNFPFDTYYTALLSNIPNAYYNVSSQGVVVQFPSYADGLNGLLYTTNITTVVNYVTWSFIYNNLDFISSSDDVIYQLWHEFKRTLPKSALKHRPSMAMPMPKNIRRNGGTIFDLPPSTTHCAAVLTMYLPLVTGQMYVNYRAQTQNLSALIDDVTDQSSRIIASFMQMVDAVSWMDKPSKKNAFLKSQNLVRNVAYPPQILNNTYLDTRNQAWINANFSSLGAAYWSNVQMEQYLYMTSNLNMITQAQALPRTDFGGSPCDVNAWYNPYVNSITFPLAVLEAPLYQYGWPQYLNYGNQGATAGHELTHGYDDEGVQFFINGTLDKYIDASSSQGFANMAQCVIGQYSSKCCPPNPDHLCANGQTTQGENIADIGGLQAAYNAYQVYVMNYGTEARLPGMENFTPNQLFWISYGYTWCNTMTASDVETQILTDVHAPEVCRTNQVLQDLPVFAQDWGCKTGQDYMSPSPDQTCTVW